MKISGLTSKCGKALTKIRNAKGTPKAMMIGGVSVIVASGVLACVRTMKLEGIVDEVRDNVEECKSFKEDGEHCFNPNTGETEEYTPAMYRKDVTHIWFKGAKEVAKLYLPSILGTGIGIAMVSGSHKIMDDRLTQTTLAFTCLSESFQKYRQNVIFDQGEEADKRYMIGLETKRNLEMNVIDPETGEVKTIKEKKIDLINDVSRIASPYAVILSDAKWWTSDLNYNTCHINAFLRILQADLDMNNYLYLYDVYKAYGMIQYLSPEAIAMSHQVGWIKGYGDDDIRISPISTHLGSEDLFSDRFLVDFNCIGGDYIDGKYVCFNDLVRGRHWLDKSLVA